ncbi:MAG: isoprenylcysteine carboxylmethyltransferase family protein [Terracidiphilus sp.]|jgi:protein-S-isoprenylcysteine O-methyltransferase Ste14
MTVSAVLFRYRMFINMVIIVLGFWAPWTQYRGIGSHILLLEWLALEISRTGLLSFTVATPVIIVCGALIAAMGAVLRIWGAAWLGHGVVFDGEMQAGALTADGPFRYARNPLYLGTGCMFAALALLMPASGALFVLVAAPLFLFYLIRGEESFLTAQFGEPYRKYLLVVPRLIPRLRTTLRPSGNKPHWLQGVISEINPIGVFVTIAFLSWTYDTQLMWRAIAVTFGLSLVVRALMPELRETTSSPE